jgi:hypothetical protein
MCSHEQELPAAHETVSLSDNMKQWAEYLHAQHLWDHFLRFAPEAIQWTYNVQC